MFGLADLLASRSLASKQEGLRVLPFTAEFEGAEILIPRPFGSFRFAFAPKLEPEEVLDRDLSFPHAVEEVVPQRGRKIRPSDLGI
jgi:hypothetical protein